MAAPLAPVLPLQAPSRACPTSRTTPRHHLQPSVSFTPAAVPGGVSGPVLRTCKNCKKQYDPAANHPSSCRHHTAHFGGETKRKFESVHVGGTMDTPGAGKVLQYWHCCGSENPFDVGCTAAPHSSYDD
ncbi:uncharacterized protein LOC124666947 [Lolium rigidum]|uniref:uncharacterized protein LOC124666947 n=1 Tax=Lolium rigidum TaxID=89674 RepID=UPI001F5DBA40|nr:uncharacterized protein LOC124666947 [Lolium rigidum]